MDPKQLNVFACGAQHWLGTTPSERAGPEGVELLPTARWLRGHGVDFHAVQRQGHSPLHKASWGGHLAFCRWLRDECGLLDDAQDRGGNYAADVADMGGHVALAAWLRAEGSGARARSLAVLSPMWSTGPDMAGPARPKRLIGRGWPRLAEARGRLEHDLALNTKEASGEPAGRGLSHLVLHTSRRQGRAQGDAVLHPARGEDVLPVLRHHVPGPLDTESGKPHILAHRALRAVARSFSYSSSVVLVSRLLYIEVRFAHNLIVAA